MAEFLNYKLQEFFGNWKIVKYKKKIQKAGKSRKYKITKNREYLKVSTSSPYPHK